MTHDAYVKADDIYKKIEDFKKLKYIANRPYKRFKLSSNLLWVFNYEKTESVVCDEGLTELIYEYCNKRIEELQEELKKL